MDDKPFRADVFKSNHGDTTTQLLLGLAVRSSFIVILHEEIPNELCALEISRQSVKQNTNYCPKSDNCIVDTSQKVYLSSLFGKEKTLALDQHLDKY